jgi:AcrR family transcriptional regulator
VATTRERLIKVATRLLDQGGPAAVTLREVGHRAGFSHNTPYKHFTDKRDLLACVAADELRRLTVLITADVAAATGAGRIEAAARAYLTWATAHPERFRLIFGPWTGPHEELEPAAGAAVESMRQAVITAQAEDAALPRDTEQVFSLVWAAVHGMIDLELAGHLRKRPESPEPADLITGLIALLRTPAP